MISLLRKKKPLPMPDPVQAVIDHEKLINQYRAEGYAEALRDFSHGLRGCNSFALISVAPCVQQMQGKLRKMQP